MATNARISLELFWIDLLGFSKQQFNFCLSSLNNPTLYKFLDSKIEQLHSFCCVCALKPVWKNMKKKQKI